MRRIALVDFDGVVLKNPNANAYIKNRVYQYMHKVTHIKNKQIIDELNRELYTAHGHTVIGLQKHGFNVSLNDFNKYLYSDKDLYENLQFTKEEHESWSSFVNRMKEEKIEIRMFSNAGIEWVSHFIKDESDCPGLFELQYMIDIFNENYPKKALLKPKRDIYDMVHTIYPDTSYYFIDDKVANFSKITNDDRWTKIWYAPYPVALPCNISKDFYRVSNLNYASNLIIEKKTMQAAV